TNDRMFERLAGAMGRPGLAAEFPTMAARVRARADLDALVQTWVGAADAVDVLARLDAAEVPCGPVASVRDLFDDPHVRARENIVRTPSPLGGLLAMVGVVPRLSASPGEIAHPGPVEVGADNEAIYCGRLGLSRDDLRALAVKGVPQPRTSLASAAAACACFSALSRPSTSTFSIASRRRVELIVSAAGVCRPRAAAAVKTSSRSAVNSRRASPRAWTRSSGGGAPGRESAAAAA